MLLLLRYGTLILGHLCHMQVVSQRSLDASSIQVATYSLCEVTARLCLIFNYEASLNSWMSVQHHLIKTLRHQPCISYLPE